MARGIIAGSADVHIGSGERPCTIATERSSRVTQRLPVWRGRAQSRCGHRRSQYGMPVLRTMGVAKPGLSFEARSVKNGPVHQCTATRHGLRTSSQSGGLAERAAGCGRGLDAKHDQPTSGVPRCPLCTSLPGLVFNGAHIMAGSAPLCWERRCPHRLRRASLHHCHGNKLTGRTSLDRAAERIPEPIEYRRSQYGIHSRDAAWWRAGEGLNIHEACR